VRGTKPKPPTDKTVVHLDLADLSVGDPNPANTAAAQAAADALKATRKGGSRSSIYDAKAVMSPTASAASSKSAPSSVASPTGSSLSSFLSKNRHTLIITSSKESFVLALPSIEDKLKWLHFLNRTITRLRMILGRPNFAAPRPELNAYN
jgi:hypothetical protein